MSWKQDSEYQRRLRTHKASNYREESIRQVRTNIAQIIDAFNEVAKKIQNKDLTREFLPSFDEWFWEKSEKAKSGESEKLIAYIDRLRRYVRIAIQLEEKPDKISKDFLAAHEFYEKLLEIFVTETENIYDLSIWERFDILEDILFTRIGRLPGKGPDDALIKLHQYLDITNCLRLMLTPAIPPVIPKNIEKKLFGLSEKISNIFAGISLNFVTDAKWFDIVSPDNEKWKLPGISYKLVMEPFLSDFGVSELKFFDTLCGYIGLRLVENKDKNEKYFILDPTFVKVFSKIGYLSHKNLEDGTIIWYPQISDDTLYLQYLALVTTNRGAIQPDFAFWISLVIAYYFYQLISDEYIDQNNLFAAFLKDDLVRVSIIPYTVRAVALHLGGLEWYTIMPVEVESRKDVLSGLLRLSRCDFTRLQAHFESQIEEEDTSEEDYMNDPRIWQRKN